METKLTQNSRINQLKSCFLDRGIPEKYLDKWFSNFNIEGPQQQKAFDIVFEAAKTNKPVILLGKFGSGKTHLATAFVKSALFYSHEARYYTLTSFFREYRMSQKDKDFNEKKFFKMVTDCKVLVLDEFNVRSDTEAENRVIQEIIDCRYSNNKQTVFCANLDYPEFVEIVGPRIIDRLKEQGAQIVVFNWESYRGKDEA